METKVRVFGRRVAGGSQVALQSGLVDVHEGRGALRQELQDLAVVPGRMAKLGRERVAGEALEQASQVAPVLRSVAEGHRELREDTAEAAVRRERLHRRFESFRLRLPGLALVREASEELGRKREARVPRDAPAPIASHSGIRDPVEGRVDLVRVEE